MTPLAKASPTACPSRTPRVARSIGSARPRRPPRSSLAPTPCPPWALVREAVVALVPGRRRLPAGDRAQRPARRRVRASLREGVRRGGRTGRHVHRRALRPVPVVRAAARGRARRRRSRITTARSSATGSSAGVLGAGRARRLGGVAAPGRGRLRRGALGRSFTLTVGAALASAAAAALLFLGSAGSSRGTTTGPATR